MLLLIDEQQEDEPIVQLQFDNIIDIEYLEDKLNDLKKQMEMYKNG